jgi:hypothetical protein
LLADRQEQSRNWSMYIVLRPVNVLLLTIGEQFQVRVGGMAPVIMLVQRTA